MRTTVVTGFSFQNAQNMKKTVLLFLLALPLLGRGQTAPDNEAIREAVSVPESRYFYPKLFNRYMLGDSTLTLQDYRHLYYGYIHQPEYDPFESPTAADSILMVFERNPDPQAKDFKALIDYGNRVLLREPFNPRHLNLLTYAYGAIGDHENELKNYRRFKMLMETIMSSGTGISEGSPWHVIYFDHTEDVMAYLDLKYLKRTVVSRTCEYVPLLVKNGKIKGYYFDFSRIYTRGPDPTQRKKPGWEFNGIKIR